MSAGDEGVYLLANDHVVPWLSACAGSLRRFNPQLRVIVIPYDRSLDRVRRLAERHHLELWNCPAPDWLDDVARPFAASARPNLLRKLATFWGPLERFLYLDADTVVLMDLEPVLAAVRARPDAIMFAHCDGLGGNLDEVYRPGPWRSTFVGAYGTHAANTGIWAASRGMLSPAGVRAVAAAGARVADEFVWYEQSFINFWIDRWSVPVGNLHDCLEPVIVWAGVPGCVDSGERLSDPAGRRVGMLHWAGYPLDERMPYAHLHRRWSAAAGGPGALS